LRLSKRRHKVEGVILIYAPMPTNNSLWHYCIARGWEDVHAVANLEELLRAIRSGKVEAVLTSSLNGLGRSLSHLKRVIGEIASYKTALIVPSLGIDTSGGSK
jgi:DNA invertase Pin-like site-specific DNA recombinase